MVANSIAKHPACDALDITNTIPFGAKTDPPIPWWRYSSWRTLKGLLGIKSPLWYRNFNYGRVDEEKQQGGLSGKPIYPVLCLWVKKFHEINNPRVPVIAGGGIFSPRDAIHLLQIGASAVSLGTVAMLRPWKVRGIIDAVNIHFKVRENSSR
jgi:dihydroorotate dehydrogenase